MQWLATGFGAGCAPWAPGTAGTVVGVVLWWLLRDLGVVAYVALTAVLVVAGIAICARAARRLGVDDHPAIVWDEIAGYLVAMIAVPGELALAAAAFVLFRLFDIVKPWPIGVIDRRVGGGLGVMADDVAAGIAANLCLQAFIFLSGR